MILSYKTIIMCLACGIRKGATEAAQGILDRMRASYAADNIGSRTVTVTYGATMYTWDRRRREDITDQAVTLLDRIEDLWKAGEEDTRPYRVVYNTALEALSKSGMKKSVCRDESLLWRMEELFRRGDDRYGDMRLYAISYTSVMNAWAGCK